MENRIIAGHSDQSGEVGRGELYNPQPLTNKERHSKGLPMIPEPLDWREKLKPLMVELIGWRNIEKIDNELLNFISQVESAALERGKQKGLEFAATSAEFAKEIARQALISEILEAGEKMKKDAQDMSITNMNYLNLNGYMQAISDYQSIIKSLEK